MFKNSEVKKLFFVQLILFIIFLILSLLFSSVTFNLYKIELVNNNSNIVGTIIKKYPELESDIIEILATKDYDNLEFGQNILNKYGLDDIEYIEYLENNNRLKNNLNFYNLLFSSIMFLILLGVYLFFLKNQYKSINKIDDYMNTILNNDYSLDIRDYKEGDISNLKNNLYKMTVKLKEQIELSENAKTNLEETLSDISHQIRTPLTSMYVINDILSDNNLSEKDRKDFLNKNKSQLERIEWLVTTLLKISRLESGTVVLKKEKVNINELIQKSIEPIQIIAELKNIELDIKTNDYYFYLDFNWTVEALINILKNACEHTNNNGKIIIDVFDNPLFLNITITDNGDGIDGKEIKHIFERFYKGSHNKDSIGIGLNMAKKIINLQDGGIECFSDINVGTTFDIKFYKKKI